MSQRLLSIQADAKTSKSLDYGWLTGILYMTPWKVRGYGNVCSMASPECAEFCLNTAGRGNFPNVQTSRLAKRMLWHDARDVFLTQLYKDINFLHRKAVRLGLKPAVRLNGTSDILWERTNPEVFSDFPHIQFYDYTKVPGRTTPANYHLTFSRSEVNDHVARKELASGTNVAVVFDTIPDTWQGFPVINGDEHDLRFLDPRPRVVGLRAKGRARGENSGFVVRSAVPRPNALPTL